MYIQIDVIVKKNFTNFVYDVVILTRIESLKKNYKKLFIF